jgi:plasmid maintenance system killer protein
MQFNLRYHIFIVLFFILLFLGSFCQADDRARDRATLRGIQSIIVKVHPLSAEWHAELEKVGLSESVLESAIEHQLQKAGIQVLPEEASNQSAVEGFLNVRLQFVDHEPAKKAFLSLDDKEEKIEKVDTKKKYVYAIRLNLRQLVALKRDPSANAFSITWQAESVGLRRLALIKDDIKRQVDVFIEAYISENPKP